MKFKIIKIIFFNVKKKKLKKSKKLNKMVNKKSIIFGIIDMSFKENSVSNK